MYLAGELMSEEEGVRRTGSASADGRTGDDGWRFIAPNPSAFVMRMAKALVRSRFSGISAPVHVLRLYHLPHLAGAGGWIARRREFSRKRKNNIRLEETAHLRPSSAEKKGDENDTLQQTRHDMDAVIRSLRTPPSLNGEETSGGRGKKKAITHDMFGCDHERPLLRRRTTVGS